MVGVIRRDFMTQTERAPLDIVSYSSVYLEGKLDKAEISELRAVLSPESWKELLRERYRLTQLEKLSSIKAKNRQQIDLSDVVALLVMLLEKP
jgi:hypothetical protein